MNAAERIVRTVNNAVTIAGLEMLQHPELTRYVTKNDQMVMKRYRQSQFKIKVMRRVLRADLAKTKKAIAACKTQDEMMDQAMYCNHIKNLAEKVPDRNFLPAVKKLQGVLSSVPFAQHVKMMAEAMEAKDAEVAFGKKCFL